MASPTAEVAALAARGAAGRRIAAAGAVVAGALVAEIAALLGGVVFGLALHVLLLASILGAAAVLAVRDSQGGQILTAFALLPLLRIISFSTPLASLSWMQWIVVIGGILYVALFGAMRALKPSLQQIRAVLPRLRDVPWELAVVALAVPIGIAEYLLIRPGPILGESNPALLVGPAVLVIIFTGVIEELFFRGLLPFVLLPSAGPLASIAIPAAAQAVLVVGFLNPAYIALVFATGLLYGLVAARTGSILGVGVAHGLSNVALFLVLPVTGFSL